MVNMQVRQKWSQKYSSMASNGLTSLRMFIYSLQSTTSDMAYGIFQGETRCHYTTPKDRNLWRMGSRFYGTFPFLYGKLLYTRHCRLRVIKAISSPTNDSRVVIKLFKKTIFPIFGVPMVFIGDGESHFISRQFENLLKKYGVRNIMDTSYHLRTSE